MEEKNQEIEEVKETEKELVPKKVPEITFSGDNYEVGKILLPTKEIPLIINGKEEKIVMQKISAGKRREVTKKHFKGNIVGQQVQGSMDALGFQISILAKVIIKAPFVASEEMLSNFSDDVIDYLYNQYDEWSKQDTKKKD